MGYLMILTTAPDEASADSLASGLIREKLAACVQLSPIQSYYTWEGKPNRDPEIRMLIKTRTGLYPSVERFIRANHPYEVPQIVGTPISDGSRDYLDWIDENTKKCAEE